MPRSSSPLRWGQLLILALVLLVFSLAPTATAQKHNNEASNVRMTKNNDYELDNEFADYDEHRNLQGNNGATTATETNRVNIWTKLKESLGATIVGFILICCMPLMIWKNEGRHVRELVRIDFAKNSAVEVECNSAGDETLGQLVHFMGPVSVGDAYLDFGGGEAKGLDLLEPLPKCLMLKRTCYIYQKTEVAQTNVQKDRIGGGETQTTTYNLKEDWFTTPQPEQLEHLTDQTNSHGIWDQLMSAAVNSQDDDAGKTADPQMVGALEQLMGGGLSRKPHGVVVGPSAKVGFFGLSRKIVLENQSEFATETIPVPTDNLPYSVSGCDGLVRGSDNVLRNFTEGETPFNGAVKVVFEYVQDGFDCSFVVQQTAKDVEGQEQPTDEETKFGVDRGLVEGKCSKDDYGDIWMVRRGRHSLEEMVDMAKEDEGKITKILRIVCWVAMFAGWVMLFSPFTTALSTLPILGTLGNVAVGIVALIVSLTCCCTIMTVAYIRYRPVLALGLLAVSLGIWGIVAWRLDDAVENGEPVE